MTHFNIQSHIHCSAAGPGPGQEVWAVCSTTPIINNEPPADESIHYNYSTEWSGLWSGPVRGRRVTSRSRDFVLVLRFAGRSASSTAYLISSCSSSRVSSSSACLGLPGFADMLGYLFLAAQLVLLTPITPPPELASPRHSHFLLETTPYGEALEPRLMHDRALNEF